MIQLLGLEKSFGSQRVLAGCTLDIQDGETMVIMGSSGCGKSVLLKLIAGLLEPDAGTVRIAGQDRRTMTPEEKSRAALGCGFLFQSSALFDSLTVGENVVFALRRHRTLGEAELRDVAEQKLNLVGLKGVQDKNPAELSGGMRKRVGLARAIAMEPALILYDEPTTGLDPIMAGAINELILDLQRRFKMTSVVVTHDMNSAFAVAGRVALLYEGRIEAVDTPEAVKNSGNEVVQQFIHGRAEGPIRML